MTIHAKRSPPGHGGDPLLECQLLAGVDGWESAPKTATAQEENRARLRRQHLVERLHALGPAPLLHLLTDLDVGKPVWPTVERYAALPADFIRANGGDRFAPSLHCIDGDGR